MKQHVGTHNILQPIRACLPVLGLLLLSLLLAACAGIFTLQLIPGGDYYYEGEIEL